MPGPARRLISRGLLAVATLTGLWTYVLATFGGFTVRAAGVRISSHNPAQPLGVMVLAGAMYVALLGRRGAADELSALSGGLGRIFARVNLLALVGILAISVVAIGLIFGTQTAGGSDSYGYVSEADLWLSDALAVRQPWIARVPWPNAAATFSPLGYLPRRVKRGNTVVEDPSAIVPKYAAGFPLLMAAAKRLGGQCAMFWVVPLCGGISILATFGIGRRIGEPLAGLMAGWLTATSPTFLYLLLQPMSDVPAAAAWAVAVWCVLSDSIGLAVFGGLVGSLAVLIRPNLLSIAAMICAWLTWRAYSARGSDRRTILRCLGFGAALVPGLVAIAGINRLWYGAIFGSGYGSLEPLFSQRHVMPNLAHYVRSLVWTQTFVVLVGFAPLFWPTGWFWSERARRLCAPILFGAVVLVTWAEYSAYEVFEPWWYLRFLLPTWPFMMVAVALVFSRPVPRIRTPGVLVGALLLGVGLHTLRWAVNWDTFAVRDLERKYVAAAQIVRARTDANAVIFSSQHSGALRYYGGRTSLDFEKLDSAWLDRAAAWLDARGAHPYALLEDWEVARFRDRFGRTNALGTLSMNPLVQYDGDRLIYLFDLSEFASRSLAVEWIVEGPSLGTCPEPAAPPTLVLK